MSDTASPYQIVTASLDQRQTLIDIWQRGLAGGHPMDSKFDWFYRDCPLGKPLVYLLHHASEDKPIGSASAGARRMLWRGREIRAGLLVDFAVDPAHRSAGPALVLARAMVEHGKQHFDLLYGFPNLRAAAITRRAGHQLIATMRRYVRVLRHGHYLHRKGMAGVLARSLGWCLDHIGTSRRHLRQLRARQIHWSWTEHADARFDNLWQASDHGDGLLQIRDAAMARWRFDQCPLIDTHYLLATDRESGDLRAWFAVHTDGDTLDVLDYWSADALVGLATPFVDGLLSAAQRRGHASVSFQFAGPASRLNGWRQAGFVARDQRPIFASLSEPGDIDEQATHFTAADEDH